MLLVDVESKLIDYINDMLNISEGTVFLDYG